MHDLDDEHQHYDRALRVEEVLHELWGDELPPAQDPLLVLLVDALALDDEHGGAARLVVQSDGLTYPGLVRALSDPEGAASRLRRLPPALRERMRAAGLLGDATRSSGVAALPSVTSGAWELDAGSELVSFDAVTARLLGVGHHRGSAPLATCLDNHVHPRDRDPVATALQRSLRDGAPYEARFRILLENGAAAWRLSRGRVLSEPGTPDARLVGFLAADD